MSVPSKIDHPNKPTTRGQPIASAPPPIALYARVPVAFLTLQLLAACAQPQRPAPDYPRSEALCQYVGLEAVETPRHVDTDSISFVAVYRFSEPNLPAPKEPLTVKFQVNRTRVNELRSHLESQPQVICTPDRDLHYQVRVKPLPEPEGGASPPPIETESAPAPPDPGAGY